MINLEKGAPRNPITHLPKLELGQKVTIKSLDWYNSSKNKYSGVIPLTPASFVRDMSKYCGKVATIVDVLKDLDGGAAIYQIDLDDRGWDWTEEMFESERVEDVKDPEE